MKKNSSKNKVNPSRNRIQNHLFNYIFVQFVYLDENYERRKCIVFVLVAI